MAIILITGCSTGIGPATAELLARHGHTVYATMRTPQNSTYLQELATKENLPLTVLPLDVDTDASVEKAIQQVLDKEDFIDVLVNNAGIAPLSPLEDTPMDVFRATMETNYFGTLRCIKAVLPSMRERKSGCIINISSVAGKIYSNFHSHYSASKAAVEALSESLGQEVKPFGIRVAIVEPGVIETPILEKMKSPDLYANYPNISRFRAFFAASKENHVSPMVVAEVVKNIIESDTTQLRHTAGPDALPLLGWRSSLTDEDWINSVMVDEQTWAAGMKEGLHLEVMPYMPKQPQDAVLS
jgi:NAD(P)-dependent dehydrogenase (short-subunit alcohol dehydrogenase family)